MNETDFKRLPLSAEIRKLIARRYRAWRSDGPMGRVVARMYYVATKQLERHILYGEPLM